MSFDLPWGILAIPIVDNDTCVLFHLLYFFLSDMHIHAQMYTHAHTHTAHGRAHAHSQKHASLYFLCFRFTSNNTCTFV